MPMTTAASANFRIGSTPADFMKDTYGSHPSTDLLHLRIALYQEALPNCGVLAGERQGHRRDWRSGYRAGAGRVSHHTRKQRGYCATFRCTIRWLQYAMA